MRSIHVTCVALLLVCLCIMGCGETPQTPAGLTVTGSWPVSLSWSSVSGAKSYKVYRGTVSGVLSSKTVIADGLTVTSYTDASAQMGTVYYYQITAVNDDGVSSGSNEVQVTAGGGTFPLVANSSAGQVVLTWSNVTGAAGYNVYRGTTPMTSGMTRIHSGVKGTTYTDTGTSAGGTYYYQIAATDTQGKETVRSMISAGVTP